MRLSIIIPAYNEEDCIASSLRRVSAILKKHFVYEIILVDDGSTDDTYGEAFSVKKQTHTRIFSYEKNKGKGYAVRYGLLKAKYKTKVILDADLSISPRELLEVDFKQKFDILKGERRQIVKQPLHRIFAGKVFRQIVSEMFDLDFDSQSPFTILRLPKNFYKGLKIDGFAFDVEILYKAMKETEQDK